MQAARQVIRQALDKTYGTLELNAINTSNGNDVTPILSEPATNQDDAPEHQPRDVTATSTNQNNEQTYHVYVRRWFVMFVVFLLNVSNGATWITYATVATIVAKFYGTSTGAVNYFSLSYLLLSIPLSFVCTYMVNKVGLGVTIHTGALFNTVGAIIKAIGTSTFISDPSTQFAVSLTGQLFAAVAQSFLLFIPTKVSQTWFPEHQRMLCTTVLSMADPIGAVVAQIATPYIIHKPDDVTINNYIWMGLAIVAQLITWATITSSKPITPPSRSSEQTENVARQPYWQQLKATFTNKSYLLLFLSIGFSIGIYASMGTVTQQMLCGFGYSTKFSGLASAFPQLFGFLGSACFSWYVSRTKRFTATCKVVYGIGALAAILMTEFYLQPDKAAYILVFCAVFGFFGVGGFPLGLELGVEATYPVEETISSAFILMCGQLQGILLITMIGALSTPQKPEYAHMQICSEDVDAHISARDYTWSMVVLMCISTVINLLLILFFETPYKRQIADREKAIQPHSDKVYTISSTDGQNTDAITQQ